MTDRYNVSNYTNEELYELLDLDEPSDSELEAKILMQIDKYSKIETTSGKLLLNFFEKIYNHFFVDDNEEEEEETDNEEYTEEKKNYTETTNIKKEKINEPVVVYTKPVEFTKGIVNPLMKQTKKRLISLDSQYRPDKTALTTNYTCNLSETLKDVVSLKLYSIQIPKSWYTIGKNYGSNFFYLKGRTGGIDTETHDIQISISPGNYNDQELIDAINNSIQTQNSLIDADISNTKVEYNSITLISEITIDILKKYNESSYYLYFPSWSSPYVSYENRNQTIASYLGFETNEYYINTIKSPLYYSLKNINIADTETFILSETNNTVTIYSYTGTETYSATESSIEHTINVSFSLSTGASYTRNELITDLSNQLKQNENLSDEVYIEQKNIDENNIETSIVSYIEIKIKLNRMLYKTITDDSKLVLIVPTDNVLWLGEKSCFRLETTVNELNTIYSDISPIIQNDRYKITSNAKIKLTCIAENFISTVNDIEIPIQNSSQEDGYSIDEYLEEINNSIRIYNENNNNILNAPDSTYIYDSNQVSAPTGTYAYLKDTKFHLYLDIHKKFDNTMYDIDLTGSIFETFIELYYDNTKYTYLHDLTLEYTSSVAVVNKTITSTDIICKITPKTTTENGNEDDVSYTLTFGNLDGFVEGSYTYPQIENFINSVFNNYTDELTGLQIFQGTLLTSSVVNNYYEILFNIEINKQLISINYSIQLIDTDYNSWKDYLYIDDLMIDSEYNMDYDIPETISSKYYNNGEPAVQILEITTDGKILISAIEQIAQTNTLTIETGINDTIYFKPYEDGIKTSTGNNDITIIIPEGIYSPDYLIETINNKIKELDREIVFSIDTRSDTNKYVKIVNKINKDYTAEDYNVVFYDNTAFSKCITGTKSIKNTTWDTTIGWIMGFRDYTLYDLSSDIVVKNNKIITITGDTGVSTDLFNYFLICIDDYNPSRLNDGLVTITGTDTDISLPSYVNKTELQCNPVTGEYTYNNTLGLTEKQIYSINEQANSKMNTTSIGSSISTKSYGTGPYATDVFAIIPLKVSNIQSGKTYVESGGTLLQQERTYFGPVDISRLTIRLVSDRGNIVDLNNTNWSFTLICEQLNKLEPTK